MKKNILWIIVLAAFVFACQSESPKELTIQPDEENLQGYWLKEDSTGFQLQPDGAAVMVNTEAAPIQEWTITEDAILALNYGTSRSTRGKELTYKITAFTGDKMSMQLRELEEEGPIVTYRHIPEDSIYLYVDMLIGKFWIKEDSAFFEDCFTGKVFEVTQNNPGYSNLEETYIKMRKNDEGPIMVQMEGARTGEDPGKISGRRIVSATMFEDCEKVLPTSYVIWVAPERRACEEMPEKGCLQVRYYNETMPFVTLHGDIKGLEHERGNQYTIYVEEVEDTIPSFKRLELKQIFNRENVKHDVDLISMRWHLKNIKGQAVPASEPGKEPYLRLYKQDGKTKVAGFSGCNPVTGSYVLMGDQKIDIGLQLDGTEPCPEEDPLLESRFLKNMMIISKYQIDGDRLTLYKKDEPYLEFEATYYE